MRFFRDNLLLLTLCVMVGIATLDSKIVLAGGLTNYDDLRNLKLLNILNIEGIISGKSFYVGNIDLNFLIGDKNVITILPKSQASSVVVNRKTNI